MHNYISNLLDYQALNGQENTSRPWALVAVILMGITTGYAAVLFSERVTASRFRLPIRYLGIIIAVFSLLAGIPAQHDLMVMLGLINTLILFFYLTFLLFKTRLTGFKIVAAAVMCFFYFVTFMYTTRSWLEWMPFMQKMVHLVKMSSILGLLYLSKPADFKEIR